MNLLKLQTDVLKLIDKNKASSIVWYSTDDFYYISDNGLQVFEVPQAQWFLDLEKCETCRNFPGLYKIINNHDGSFAELTGEIRVLDKKQTVVKIENEKAHAWVDKKLLDRFALDDANFDIINFKSPVLVYDGDDVVGLIMPVVLKEDSDGAVSSSN